MQKFELIFFRSCRHRRWWEAKKWFIKWNVEGKTNSARFSQSTNQVPLEFRLQQRNQLPWTTIVWEAVNLIHSSCLWAWQSKTEFSMFVWRSKQVSYISFVMYLWIFSQQLAVYRQAILSCRCRSVFTLSVGPTVKVKYGTTMYDNLECMLAL